MNKRLLSQLLLFVAIGVGLLSGWADVAWVNSTATTISDLFLRLLKLVSLPIIFLAVTSTMTGMKNLQEMKKIGRKVLLYTLGTTVIAATIALFLYLIIDPTRATVGMEKLISPEALAQPSYFSFLLNIVPSNILTVFTEGNVLGIIFLAILFSVAILFLPQEQRSFLNQLFSSLFAAMIKITGFIIALMPLAIWAFMVLLVKDLKQNYDHLNRLILYLSCVVSANLIQGIVILPLFLKAKKLSPWKIFKGMAPALTVAFFTKSSNATLPVTIQSAEKNLGVSSKIANFTLPLCSIINMNGCAAFILITTIFVSSVNGLTFTPTDLIFWVGFATLAAIGNAGVPMGCFFLTSAFLIGMDVPLYMMGLILPFYTILDMIETALNVWSDACITTVVDHEVTEKNPLPLATPEQA